MKASLLTSAVLSFACLAGATSHAKDVYVGGPGGLVFRGNSVDGGFQFLGTCGGPIQSMVAIGDTLYLGTNTGLVYRVNAEFGFSMGAFGVPNTSDAMTKHDGDLLIGGMNPTVLRVDPATGAVLETYTVPEPVTAIVVVGEYIYTSGPASSIYRAHVSDGVFSYFTCSCFGAVNGLAASGEDLFLVDSFGAIWRVDLVTGLPMSAFFIDNVGEALLIDQSGNAVVGDATGHVRTHDLSNGDEINAITVPIPIFAITSAVPACPVDLSGDGHIDLLDVSILLAHFNVDNFGDLDNDNQTTLSDLAILLAQYGNTCE